MTVATTTDAVRRATALKLVASAGVLATAVGVAGLGTFGGFTDSTAPVAVDVESGVLSIDVSDAGGSGSIPFDGGLFRAGESRSHYIDLVNDGDTALSSVTLATWASESSILDSDAVNGLQLSVQSCSEAWAGTSCGGAVETFYDGPFVVTDHLLAGAASLEPGEVDHLRLVASLPASASGAAFQNVSSTLNLVFTGTQRDGEAR